MKNKRIKPLDIVRTRGSFMMGQRFDNGITTDMVGTVSTTHVGIVVEVQGVSGNCSIDWIGKDPNPPHNAWWEQSDLELMDSLPSIIARNMVHPFGNNAQYVEEQFPVVERELIGDVEE